MQALSLRATLWPWWVKSLTEAALRVDALRTAVAVFLVLYLAVGVGVYGHGFTFGNVWLALTWPYQMLALTQVVVLVLAAFTGVSLFVGWLKGRYLLADKTATEALAKPWESLWQTPPPEPQTAQTGELEAELAALRGKVKILQANLENETRQSAQARMRAAEAEAKLHKAEIRAAAAETNARYAKQRAEGDAGNGSPPPDEAAAGKGGDKKFKRAKRVFAKMYYPDPTQKGLEKMLREQIYKEFWQVLEAIDDGKPLPEFAR
jgi:hypothetical protein